MKLYLLSGFLGSGKTTLLKRIIEKNPDSRIGIIMNEFGKISIDGPIVKGDGIEMIELTRGSIFCSCLKFSFAEALVEMSKKDLDHVIVESSGLADPSNIGEVLEAVEGLSDVPYEYSGSITVVDALNFSEQFDEIETVKRQIECADITIINKIDLVNEDELSRIGKLIAETNPETALVHSSFFDIPMDFVGRNITNGYIRQAKDSLNTPENKPKTISLSFQGTASKSELDSFLRDVWPSTYRIKGFVMTDAGEKQLDVVGKKVDYGDSADKTAESGLGESTIVFISKIGPQIIRVVDSAWKKHVSLPMKLGN